MEDIFPYEIRWARPQEWNPTMSMVWDTFMKFEGEDYSAEGIRNFYDFITDEKLYQSFLKGKYQMMVALEEGRVVGMASVRNRNHLSLLFVKDTHHRRGIGRQLLECFCRYLSTELGERSMTVQAAPYALDFYRRTGFRETGPEQQFSGIRVTSMERRF